MSASPDINIRLITSPGGYGLLRKYMKESKILSTAYSYSESKFIQLHKWLTYPIIILSASASVCAGLDINQYAIMSLSLSILILSGFNSAINPKERENRANQVKTEFGEISSNISQFIYENDKSKEEIKAYSQLINEMLNTWKGQAPPIKDFYIKKAKRECIDRVRESTIKKKESV